MPITTYNAHALTGENGDRILAELDPTALLDGDRCFATVDGEFLVFKYVFGATDETDIVDHPFKVRPNAYAGSGVWIEQIVSTSVVVLFGTGSPPSAVGQRDGTIYAMYS